MNQPAGIPVFKLYGEREQWPTPDMVHCELIAARSQLHNWQIKPHRHNGLFQILYLQQGKAEIRLEENRYPMAAGQVLIVPQMCVHGLTFERGAVGYVITLAYPLIHQLTRQAGDGLLALTGPSMHSLGEGSESGPIKMAFNALDTEYRRNAPYRHLLMEALLGAILIWLARDALPQAGGRAKEAEEKGRKGAGRGERRKAAGRGRGAEHFGCFCDLIEQHYTDHHPVSFYASRIGITAAHLNVLCRQAVGKSALDLIHERVLLEAKRKLVYTSMPVSVMAYAIGFADPAYFTRFFKRWAGMSPKDFRRQAGT